MSESRGRDSANISFQSSLVTLQNQPSSNRSRHGFTQLYEGLTRVLNSKVGVTGPFLPDSGKPEPRLVEFDAIWDTGASGSVITTNVVLALRLKPIDRQIVQTANGEREANVYLLNLHLPNRVGVSLVRVTDGDMHGTDVLIGMDIINLGDFAVTNFKGRTCMSFQCPSARRIDFVKEIRSVNAPKKRRGRKRKRRKRR